MKTLIFIISLGFIVTGCKSNKTNNDLLAADTMLFAGEKHFKNVRMLTLEGENAEAYFSFNQQKLIYQSTHGDYKCDQIFTMNLDGSDSKLVSTGLGRTTCSFFLPGDERT